MVYYNHSKGIHKVLVKSTGISEEFTKLNFKPSEYKSKNVLRAIDKILKSTGISEEFTKRNFTPSAYKSKDGRMLREYNLTRDGFVMVTMGFLFNFFRR